jgi:hypothetical protein
MSALSQATSGAIGTVIANAIVYPLGILNVT